MNKIIRIGTRDSQLAVWQATLVQKMLAEHGYASELVYIKSEGDIDLVTPLYEIGVQGIFTKTLDAALLNKRIDIAVHSLKDVPIQPAKGLYKAAVLKRGAYTDTLVVKKGTEFLNGNQVKAVIATSSTRRKAQWLHRYPHHSITNLRGNVNTRLQKVKDNEWHGAIFATAGLERTGLKPADAIELDWMLPAPGQGAVVCVCNEDDQVSRDACAHLNDADTNICTSIERDFLRTLMGGCSVPIAALAKITDGVVNFKGNILSPDGVQKEEVAIQLPVHDCENMGIEVAHRILRSETGSAIVQSLRNA